MADLKVNQNDLEELKSNFDNIRNTLSLQSDGSISPSIENVGHRKVVTALRGFNRQVQSTRNKYQKKVERFSVLLIKLSRVLTTRIQIWRKLFRRQLRQYQPPQVGIVPSDGYFLVFNTRFVMRNVRHFVVMGNHG